MYFNGRRVKIKVRANLFCVFAASVIGLVGHTFFKGDNMRLSSALSSMPIKTLRIFWKYLWIRVNTIRPALYGVNQENSTEMCFKYNILDTVHNVFFRSSMVWKASWRPSSPSSSFGWAFFFLAGWGGGKRCCCLLLYCFVLFFFWFFVSSYVFPLLLLLTLIISKLQEVLWYTYFSLLGVISHD